MTCYSGNVVFTTPSVSTATSTTLLEENTNRKYLFIQNNTAANIMVSFDGAVLGRSEVMAGN